MCSGRKDWVLGWPPVNRKEKGSSLRTGRHRAVEKGSVAMRRMKEEGTGRNVGPPEEAQEPRVPG